VNRAGRNPFPFADGWDYSQAVAADGPFLFVSGQGGFGADGEVVGRDDPERQIRQSFANVRAVLEANGSSLQNVVRVNVFLADASLYDAFKRVRHEVFQPPYPASTATVAGGFLFEGMLVEIDAVATIDQPRTAG
jgi:enamine deaminase RidA (YjgF/YER057c/UK114 family)